MVKKLSTKKQLHMCKKKWKKVREATEIGKSKVKKGSELLWSLLKTQIQKFFLRKKLHMCKNISRKNGKERKVKKVYFPWNIKGRETIARKIHGFWIFEIPRKNSLLKTAHVHFFRLSKKVHVKYIANREVFLLRIGGQKLQNEKLHMCKRHQKCT